MEGDAIDMKELLDILNKVKPGIDYVNEKHLVSDELIDSLDVMTIVTEICDEFDVEILPTDVVPASGGLVRDELYLLFLSAVFSGGAGGFILSDTLEKTVVGAAGRQLFLLLDGLRKNDCFSADHNRFGLSGSSGYGAGAAGL